MYIKDWKKEMIDLVQDFQFHKNAGDLDRLKELVAEAEKIAEGAIKLAEGL